MNRTPRPTIITIARACGVTDGTVSRALRGDPRVAPATRQRVEECAVALGYRPHAYARSLKNGRAGAVGLFCEPGAWVLYNSYFGRLMAGVAQAAEDERTRVVVYLPTHSPELPGKGNRLSGLDALTEGRVDAGVVLGGSHWDYEGLRVAKASGLPLLLLAPDTLMEGYHQVMSGLEERVTLAAEALFKAGRRRLAWMGLFAQEPHDLLSVEVMKAFAKRHKLPAPLWTASQFSNLTDPSQIEPGLRRLIDGGCDGLIVANAGQAIVCMDVLQTMKVKVPDDLSLISFGPPPFSILARRPALALVNVDLENEGRKAWQLLKQVRTAEQPLLEHLRWSYAPPSGPNTVSR